MKNLLIFLFLSYAVKIAAQAPEGYYDGTDGLSGQALKVKVHQIISNHRVRTYGEFRDIILPDLDEDPNNPNNIILFYKNISIPKSNFATNNEADFWNREHTWPKSHGFPDLSDTAYTDVHNLRPSDATVNSSKSNKDFNNVNHTTANEEGEAPNTYTDNDFWEPRDEIKGDVARILFYMATRYESSTLDLELVDRISFSGDPELGVLYTMIQWHNQDPVSDSEKERHEGAYGYQENRNPFVDHPEWVAAIWSDATNPYITINQSNFNSDFGTVPFGESKSQQYKVNAYNLEADLSLATNTPFQLSTDGINYSDNITFAHNTGVSSEVFTTYLKFEPSTSDGGTYERLVTHTSSNLESVTLNVLGKEGEVTITTIAEARKQALGTVAFVTGVVIDAGNNSGNSRVIYDGTAGIVVRSFDAGNESSSLVQGDSIVVSGGLSEYGLLLQIEESPIVIDLIAQGATLPNPQEITISEVSDVYESELVVIRDVTFSDVGKAFDGGGTAGNFEISDPTGSMVFRIGNADHPLVGTQVPSGTFDLTGYIGQFFDDYQFYVRDENDLTQVSEGTGDEPELITIAEARTKSEGDIVSIKGLVIGGVGNSDINRVVYDGTAGLVVRSRDLGNLSSNLELGDSVTVSGGILDYNGLFEIENSPIKLEVLNSGNTLPDPQSITIDQLGEDYESELVALLDVSITETGAFNVGDYTLTDGSSEVIFRIGAANNPLVGTTIPKSSFNLIGYVGQSNEKYQVFIDVEDDLTILQSVLKGQNAGLRLDLIYPNPVEETLYLNTSLSYPVEMNIVNLNGQAIQKKTLLSSATDVSKIKKGVYFVIIEEGVQSYYSRMIKK